MAPILKKWLWLPLWATSMVLVLTVKPTSQWMAGLEILPGLLAAFLLVVRNYKSTMAYMRKLRGNA